MLFYQEEKLIEAAILIEAMTVVNYNTIHYNTFL